VYVEHRSAVNADEGYLRMDLRLVRFAHSYSVTCNFVKGSTRIAKEGTMRKLAILIVLELGMATGGCGTNNPNSGNKGDWEAQLFGGTDQASLLNFIVSFSVVDSGPLHITGFAFFNQGACFSTDQKSNSASGDASFTTANGGKVDGTLNLTVTSKTNDSVLALTGELTGTSNATATSTGTLSNGVVTGKWTLSPGTNAPNCNAGSGAFVMCQGAATCQTP
jgi:hypothetical protein